MSKFPQFVKIVTLDLSQYNHVIMHIIILTYKYALIKAFNYKPEHIEVPGYHTSAQQSCLNDAINEQELCSQEVLDLLSLEILKKRGLRAHDHLSTALLKQKLMIQRRYMLPFLSFLKKSATPGMMAKGMESFYEYPQSRPGPNHFI